MSDLPLDRSFAPTPDVADALHPLVRRITAPNGGPYTFRGTNTYLVGRGDVAVIDPGPDDDEHLAALLRETEGETIRFIVLTHSHRDHSAAVPALKARTGAIVVAEGPHRPARPPMPDEVARLDSAGDFDLVPDLRLADGETLSGDGWGLEAIATPGHAANHMAFALSGEDVLFSGDHVMGWSTTIVAPPDGAMADYMASLDKLAARPERLYLPGHGGEIADGPAFVRGLKAHRRMREAAILDRIRKGDCEIAAIVASIYRDTPPALHGAAALSVLAHVEDLAARGRVALNAGAGLGGLYSAL